MAKRFAGLSKSEISTHVFGLLDTFGMSHLKKTATANLSGGQKRKLSVLTAFLGEPQLVILDEPTSGWTRFLVVQFGMSFCTIEPRPPLLSPRISWMKLSCCPIA